MPQVKSQGSRQAVAAWKLKNRLCRVCRGIWKTKQGIVALLFMMEETEISWCSGGAGVSLSHRWFQLAWRFLATELGIKEGREATTEGGTLRKPSHPSKLQRAPLPFFSWWRESRNVNGVWNVKCEWTLSNWHGASASLPISFSLLGRPEKMSSVSSSF